MGSHLFLDSDVLDTQLTPEIALSIAKETISRKYWKDFDIVGIKLVYTPFYIFSFDLGGEGVPPTSDRIAINAHTAEINPLILQIIQQPVNKSKETNADYKADVEATAIPQDQVKEVAATKIANMAGIKKENVFISAVYKLYVPFWRLWVRVGGDVYRLDIDGALGAPLGLEKIPEREKKWLEVAGETVQKMQTPSGLIDLTADAVGSATKAATGGETKGFFGWLLGTETGKTVLILIAIIILAYFVFFK